MESTDRVNATKLLLVIPRAIERESDFVFSTLASESDLFWAAVSALPNESALALMKKLKESFLLCMDETVSLSASISFNKSSLKQEVNTSVKAKTTKSSLAIVDLIEELFPDKISNELFIHK